MIVCPLCRGAAVETGHRPPFTAYRCAQCQHTFYLPAYLGYPAGQPCADPPVQLRARLWALEDCMAFLLETGQVGRVEREQYRLWQAREQAQLAALASPPPPASAQMCGGETCPP